MGSHEPAILDLHEASSADLGNKARALARLMAARPTLFRVPEGWVLRPRFDLDDPLALDELHERAGQGPFAVRSCGFDEDSSGSSLAGRYRTELNVDTTDLKQAVAAVRQSLGKGAGRGAVIVQRMVAPEFAGVLFTRSPQNQGLSACEFTAGTADELVSGKTPPTTANYGRWSGEFYPDVETRHREMLELVFLVGTIIEESFGAPQDIEWAWIAASRELFVLQSRDITATTVPPSIAMEQERVAARVLATRAHATGKPSFTTAAVREIVREPSAMTRALLERLYAADGSFGLALDRLGFPVAETDPEKPYVQSLFGKLYSDPALERQLLGFTPRRWLETRRWQRRWRSDPQEVENLAQELLGEMDKPRDEPAPAKKATECARQALEAARSFEREIYPRAFAATLLAQITGAEGAGGATARLLCDLSRLHHTGDTPTFLDSWGHRSARDYELSEPTFSEDPGRALDYSRGFANLPWDTQTEDRGLSAVKETAKDLAIRHLSPLRQSLLHLASTLRLDDPDAVFDLDLDDLEEIAEGRLAGRAIAKRLSQRRSRESAWSQVELGDEVTMRAVETLGRHGAQPGAGLSGTLIAAEAAFGGLVRTAESDSGHDTPAGRVLVTRYLEPTLVGLFPETSGCIADVGGRLSHAAIVARELDYPILVLPGASSTLATGDRVEVSAAGEVRVSRQTEET